MDAQMAARDEDQRVKLRKRIVFELENAIREKRDFRFSSDVKRVLKIQYGAQAVCDTLIQEIRRAYMPCIEPFDPLMDLSKFIKSVRKSATQVFVGWFYLVENGANVRHRGLLFMSNLSGSKLSTFLNGDSDNIHERKNKYQMVCQLFTQ